MKKIAELDRSWEMPISFNERGEAVEFHSMQKDARQSDAARIKMVSPFVFQAALKPLRMTRRHSNSVLLEFQSRDGAIIPCQPFGIESIFRELYSGMLSLDGENRLEGLFEFRKQSKAFGIVALSMEDRREYGLL